MSLVLLAFNGGIPGISPLMSAHPKAFSLSTFNSCEAFRIL